MANHPPVTERTAGKPQKQTLVKHHKPLLSDESTIELVIKGRAGDRLALEALIQRCLPALKRWAHGRLPPAARGALDTGDLVQEATLNALKRLDTFVPDHVGAMQAYLRLSVMNRIRDAVRQAKRRPAAEELPSEHPSDATSPLETLIQSESYERYRRALDNLKTRDREIVVARVEAQWSVVQINNHFGFPTKEAARMAISRAVKRLVEEMKPKN
jgi:RNA polymerase sigma-70 factor (ECF subfamily)